TQELLTAPIPRLRSIDPEISPELEELVMSALERDRDKRLPTAAALAKGLTAQLTKIGAPAPEQGVGVLVEQLFPQGDEPGMGEGTISRAITTPNGTLPHAEAAPAQLISPANQAPAMRRARYVTPLVFTAAIFSGLLAWRLSDKNAPPSA